MLVGRGVGVLVGRGVDVLVGGGVDVLVGSGPTYASLMASATVSIPSEETSSLTVTEP